MVQRFELTSAYSRLFFFPLQILTYFLNLVLFEDCKTQWSVSRPMLGLIILQPAFFEGAQQEILMALPPHRQAVVAQCFRNLLADIDQTLSVSNRDKFTEQLCIFKRDASGWPSSLATSTGTASAAAGMDTMMS
jgi:hypothetical protein